MEKQNPANILRIYSMLLLLLAALIVVSLGLGLTLGDMSVARIAQSANTTEAMAQTSIGLIIGVAVVACLVEVFLGVQGLRQSRGARVSGAHIVVAWIALFVACVSTIFVLIAVVNGTAKWYELCSAIANAGILFFYIKTAKIVKNALAQGQQPA